MKKITLFTFLTILLCTSCVTKKKFMLAELAATASKDSLQGLLTDCRNTGNQMSVQIKNLMRDTTKMGNSIRQYQSMLNVNMTEQEKLNALLNQKKNELNERERTINELQQMINAQNEKVRKLLSSVKDALLGFSSDELTVREKDGKVYVAMSDKLLFQSGSARLDKRGEEALGKLAEVLNKQGHPEQAIPIINDIRAKHGNMPAMKGTSQAEVQAQIEHERIIEFPLESYRWYDLRRWGKLTEALGSRGFVEGKHNFFPIPLWEINANPTLNSTVEETTE